VGNEINEHLIRVFGTAPNRVSDVATWSSDQLKRWTICSSDAMRFPRSVGSGGARRRFTGPTGHEGRSRLSEDASIDAAPRPKRVNASPSQEGGYK